MLKGKTIVLGVTGGIAAFKAAALCSKLKQAGASVHVIMTEGATKFVTPLTFQSLSRSLVFTDTFDEQDPSQISHIDLADRADLFIVAPATANIIAKMAHGLADDMLSTTLLATMAPVMVAPAMNVHMYDHPATRANMQTLRERGIRFVEPGVGQLACGYVGKGRLAEPEEIMIGIHSFFHEKQLLKGKKVLVTAGGTIERIDPVRYISNDSSGKMGYAIAGEAYRAGAEVTLVSAQTNLPVPDGVKFVKVNSAQDMMDAVLARFDTLDVVFKSAAVSDYRPVEQLDHKMKKKEDEWVIRLVKTPDILQTLGERKTTQFVVGFAAETNNLDAYAQDKLKRKNCDLLVANDVSQEGAGFGVDTNIAKVFDANGVVEELPLQSKQDMARRLLQIVALRLESKPSSEEN
ncbi:bifunctional phosphopantothenoylcysteine decarboxylase/phosphopantothenate--cysteine ligase CoaBC [Paenibacillus sp. N1-5-1-14]|uniref:bifunctional phosphopantothenoylcysteine decarboxylase/phosphopantothenate--cysteine ligase CoaBC n=1 Tax=Paenibacillus radicibacter TaxID=2972488 RepID=UPI00215940E5|nr:bifunctional phosphopantothenoylcysteine decarboxylase/phosphopantothenate--cysteine ligase CoaBC [Paenibacillus radicibacter]MCR8641715.1 bifunctional phosphopantothenoylcysteine decarboxylase/phosphopantothenate--cysteine ligase CoaBC [Paenibacillus radicibacter]